MEILFLSASRSEKGCNVIFIFTLLLAVYDPITRESVQEMRLPILPIGDALSYLSTSIVLPLSYKCIFLLESQLCNPQGHAFYSSFLIGYKVEVGKVDEKRKHLHMSQIIKMIFLKLKLKISTWKNVNIPQA